MLDVTVEMNLNQVVTAREGYNLFDLLSDVGGMQGLLISGCAVWLGIWNYHFLDNFLVTKLYRLSTAELTKQESIAGKQHLVFNANPLRSISDYFCEMLPNKWQCCDRHSQQSRGLKKGRFTLQKETNVCTIVRQLRFFEKAINTLISKRQRKSLWKESLKKELLLAK